MDKLLTTAQAAEVLTAILAVQNLAGTFKILLPARGKDRLVKVLHGHDGYIYVEYEHEISTLQQFMDDRAKQERYESTVLFCQEYGLPQE